MCEGKQGIIDVQRHTLREELQEIIKCILNSNLSHTTTFL